MKHNVLSADALTKFIVIASASRGTETVGSNMMRTAQASTEVANLGTAVKGVELVTDAQILADIDYTPWG